MTKIGIGTSSGISAPAAAVAVQVTPEPEPEPIVGIPSISGLEYYFDADSIVANDGDTLAQWNDLSGNNRHAVQSNAALRPKYRPTGFAGKPGVQIEGNRTSGEHNIDRYFTLPDNTLSDPITIFGVFMWTHTRVETGSNILLLKHSYLPGANFGHTGIYTSPYGWVDCYTVRARNGGPNGGAGFIWGGLGARMNTPLIMTVVCEGNEDLPDVWINGSVETDGAHDWYTAVTTFGLPSIGGNCPGMIGALAVYNTALSSSDRAYLTDFYKNKYGIS